MVADMSSDRAMIDELERAGTEPAAITFRPAPDVARPSPHGGAPRHLGQRVLVLQGGGALGAYQVGVYQALHEAGIEPDWVVGTSIGAINASLIAGGEPADRMDRLEEFWSRVEHGPLHRLFGAMPMFGPMVANMLTVSARHPGLLPAQPDGLHGRARAARAGRRRLLRHGAAAGDLERAGRLRPDQPQADPAHGRCRQRRHRRDALLRQPDHGARRPPRDGIGSLAARLPGRAHRRRALLGRRHPVEHARGDGVRRQPPPGTPLCSRSTSGTRTAASRPRCGR